MCFIHKLSGAVLWHIQASMLKVRGMGGLVTKPVYLCHRRLQNKRMGHSHRKSCWFSPHSDPGSGRVCRSCCSGLDIPPEPREWSLLSPPGPEWSHSAAESEYNPESPSAWTLCLLKTHKGHWNTSGLFSFSFSLPLYLCVGYTYNPCLFNA